MKVISDYAILDVKKGRKKLAKHFAERPSSDPCPQHLRIPVTLTGYLDGQVSGDDGTSIEFGVAVESLSVGFR